MSGPDWRSLARHGVAIATVRAFTEESGSSRVVVLLDVGNGASLMLECEPGRAMELTGGGDTFVVPVEATAGVRALPVAIPRAAPGTAVEIDVEAGEVAAPVGVVPSLATGVMALARALGGRTVATAEFPTSDPERSLTIAARDGEKVVLALGEEQFEL